MAVILVTNNHAYHAKLTEFFSYYRFVSLGRAHLLLMMLDWKQSGRSPCGGMEHALEVHHNIHT